MKLDYVDIIKKSWQIIWKYKWLWLFGFFAALGSGGSNFSNFSRYSTNSGNTSTAGANFNQFVSTYVVLIIFVVLLLMAIGLAVTVASIIAQGALIGSAAAADKEEPASLRLGWQIGLKYFWRLLGLGLLVGLVILFIVAIPIAVIVAAVVIGASAGSSMTPALFCLLPVGLVFLLILFVVAVLLGVSANYGSRYIVLDGAGVIDGLKRGFSLLRLRWIDTLLMYLLMGVIGTVVGLVLLIPGAAIGLPALALLIGGVAAKSIFIVATGVFVGMLAVLVMSILNGVFVAYSSVVWTLVYRRLTAR